MRQKPKVKACHEFSMPASDQSFGFDTFRVFFSFLPGDFPGCNKFYGHYTIVV